MESWRNRIVGYSDESPDQLLASPYNWRIHPKAQQDALLGVLREAGIVQNILANRTTGHLIDGHLRVSLALRDGQPTVPVTWVELSEAEEQLVLATLDPIAALAIADKEKLDGLLRDTKPADAALQQFLSELAAKEGLYTGNGGGALEDVPEPQIDRAAELQEKWGTCIGQIWALGSHRLAIGDCRDKLLVDRLMCGEFAASVITDPPYGIEREGILNDDPQGLQDLYREMLDVMPMSDGILIAFQSPRLFWVLLDAARKHGFKVERMLWMYKPNDETFPWRGWLLKSEAILSMSRGKAEWLDVHPYAHDVYSPTTLGRELSDGQGWHASVKPLDVIRDIVSRVGGLVYEPFCGSGTTLLACEQLKRYCRAIELSPSSAGVTLQRWDDMTGLSPRLVAS